MGVYGENALACSSRLCPRCGRPRDPPLRAPGGGQASWTSSLVLRILGKTTESKMNGSLWGLQYQACPLEGGLRAGPGDQGRTGHGPPGVHRAPRGAACAITWLGCSSWSDSLEAPVSSRVGRGWWQASWLDVEAPCWASVAGQRAWRVCGLQGGRAVVAG